MSNKHCSHILSAKVGTALLNQRIHIISCYKKYCIKTFTVDFVSITKTKQADCDPKYLQQVQWSGSSQHYRASISQVESENQKVISCQKPKTQSKVQGALTKKIPFQSVFQTLPYPVRIIQIIIWEHRRQTAITLLEDLSSCKVLFPLQCKNFLTMPCTVYFLRW